ncbi:hypothetical protein GCM10010363_28270 [Streptomyces omiyaensis]|nr:hypothetical protein GCM10010363_28270 [Streptomyces omiyaensis]
MTCPAALVRFAEPPRHPARRVLGVGDADLDVGTPERETLLADAAGRQDDVPAVLRVAEDADGGGHPAVEGVGLAVRAGLLAEGDARVDGVEGDARVDGVEADAGEDPSVVEADGGGSAGLAGGPAAVGLGDGGVGESSVECHRRVLGDAVLPRGGGRGVFARGGAPAVGCGGATALRGRPQAPVGQFTRP